MRRGRVQYQLNLPGEQRSGSLRIALERRDRLQRPALVVVVLDPLRGPAVGDPQARVLLDLLADRIARALAVVIIRANYRRI